MRLFETDPFIPVQREGKELDLENSVTKDTGESAAGLYKKACKRLLCPFLWHELAGTGAEFTIYEKENSSRPVEVDDHLYIDIPLSGPGHDWVIVEDIRYSVIHQADESIGLRLRACADPVGADESTHHFFTGSATSTIIIKRIDNVVTASYHGRNEKPNIETGDIASNIRNGIVAAGAIIGLSKIQWTALLKGLLEE